MSAQNSGNTTTGRLILVRHTQIEQRFTKLCYGASDIDLSTHGKQHARELAITLARERPTMIIHSGLSRARFLAHEIAQHAKLDATTDERLKEMNFGQWELQSWDEIFKDVGHGMSKLIHEPDTFSAPGGETAHQVRDRMTAWAQDLPRDQTIIAVSHGGAISTLRGTLAGAQSSRWPKLMPDYGEVLHFPLPISF